MRAELAEIRDFLAATPPFSLLDAALLDALPAKLAIRYLRRGSVFPPPEEDGRAACLIRQGAVELRDGGGRLLARLAEGRSMLDLCCYSGGFSVHAAMAGAKDVHAVDLDENAIVMAQRNANLNSSRVKFTHADAFTWARTMVENGREWDLVIADPPKFVTGRDDEKGRGKYHDLNKLAAQLVKPGGFLVTCSCSGTLSEFEFEKLVTTAVHKLGRRLQIIDRTGAGPDHPTLSNYPGSRYLKVIWARVW